MGTGNFLKDVKLMTGQLNKLVRELPRLAGAEMENSIVENFRSESFFGTPWLPRQQQEGNEGKGLLVQSGRLRRSFTIDVRGLTAIIHSDAPYAQVHNEGGRIEQSIVITPQMRKFFWARFYETKDEKWKGLALTKKSKIDRTIEVPQRQFMGEHAELDTRIGALIEAELDQIFKK